MMIDLKELLNPDFYKDLPETSVDGRNKQAFLSELCEYVEGSLPDAVRQIPSALILAVARTYLDASIEEECDLARDTLEEIVDKNRGRAGKLIGLAVVAFTLPESEGVSSVDPQTRQARALRLMGLGSRATLEEASVILPCIKEGLKSDHWFVRQEAARASSDLAWHHAELADHETLALLLPLAKAEEGLEDFGARVLADAIRTNVERRLDTIEDKKIEPLGKEDAALLQAVLAKGFLLEPVRRGLGPVLAGIRKKRPELL